MRIVASSCLLLLASYVMVSRQQGVKDLTKAERSTIDAMRRVRQRVGKKVIKIGLGSISRAMNRSTASKQCFEAVLRSKCFEATASKHCFEASASK